MPRKRRRPPVWHERIGPGTKGLSRPAVPPRSGCLDRAGSGRQRGMRWKTLLERVAENPPLTVAARGKASPPEGQRDSGGRRPRSPQFYLMVPSTFLRFLPRYIIEWQKLANWCPIVPLPNPYPPRPNKNLWIRVTKVLSGGLSSRGQKKLKAMTGFRLWEGLLFNGDQMQKTILFTWLSNSASLGAHTQQETLGVKTHSP
jgi:hypothetical protein